MIQQIRRYFWNCSIAASGLRGREQKWPVRAWLWPRRIWSIHYYLCVCLSFIAFSCLRILMAKLTGPNDVTGAVKRSLFPFPLSGVMLQRTHRTIDTLMVTSLRYPLNRHRLANVFNQQKAKRINAKREKNRKIDEQTEIVIAGTGWRTFVSESIKLATLGCKESILKPARNYRELLDTTSGDFIVSLSLVFSWIIDHSFELELRFVLGYVRYDHIISSINSLYVS